MPHPQYTDAFIREFWSRFDLESSPFGCWLWDGSLWKKSGYGRVQCEGETIRIHRVSYELTRGPIPDDLIIRHACSGNYAFRDFTYRRCGRPSHLLTGTPADNSADMVREERQIQGILAPRDSQTVSASPNRKPGSWSTARRICVCVPWRA